MSRNDRALAEDILVSAKLAIGYVTGLTLDEFRSNTGAQDAVIRRIEIIGEAARLLSPSFKAGLPTLPWSRIVGMRHLIVHEYWDIDLEFVWLVVHDELPILISTIEPIQSLP